MLLYSSISSSDVMESSSDSDDVVDLSSDSDLDYKQFDWLK